MTTKLCDVCDGTIPDEYTKWDPQAPVYTDDGVYHLGCEDDVFAEVFSSVE